MAYASTFHMLQAAKSSEKFEVVGVKCCGPFPKPHSASWTFSSAPIPLQKSLLAQRSSLQSLCSNIEDGEKNSTQISDSTLHSKCGEAPNGADARESCLSRPDPE